jgi:hypothetical protein
MCGDVGAGSNQAVAGRLNLEYGGKQKRDTALDCS